MNLRKAAFALLRSEKYEVDELVGVRLALVSEEDTGFWRRSSFSEYSFTSG
jgi:hypothetical protein